MFCLLKLKKASLALRIESRLENIFSIGIMSQVRLDLIVRVSPVEKKV